MPLSNICDFPDHPYLVKDDENMLELVYSIKTKGLIRPVIVRPIENGMYEIVSRHRRKRAFEIADFDTITARVKEMSKDEAILSMVDSNLQRDEILSSEKARAYKMRLDAMKRQGKRTDLTLSPTEAQDWIYESMEYNDCTPSHAIRLYDLERLWTAADLQEKL